MPIYRDLRIYKSNGPAVVARKKRVADRVLALRRALREHIGESADGTTEARDPRQYMRLATWNIREFPSGKYGYRLTGESKFYIAEILSHFDVIALQEIRDDLSALDEVMRVLGHGWDYIATDVTEGAGGNDERMVFVYNRAKVSFERVAGEVVLTSSDAIAYPHEERLAWSGLELELPSGERLQSPTDVNTRTRSGKTKLIEDLPIDLPAGTKLVLKKGTKVVLPRNHEVEPTADGGIKLPTTRKVSFDRKVTVDLPTDSIIGEKLQFARQPFIVNLQSGWLKLMLCTVHIYYGSASEKDAGMRRRKAEIKNLTKFLAKRAQSESDSDAANFFVVLGDFNIVGKDHGTMAALKSSGFDVPKELTKIPGSNVDKSKAYDQIAFWSPKPGSKKADHALDVIDIEVSRAGVFDFFQHVFRRGAQDPDGIDEATYTPLMNEMHDEVGSEGTWTYKEWRTFQMSDHLPMWIELRVDFGDDYLEAIQEQDFS